MKTLIDSFFFQLRTKTINDVKDSSQGGRGFPKRANALKIRILIYQHS